MLRAGRLPLRTGRRAGRAGWQGTTRADVDHLCDRLRECFADARKRKAKLQRVAVTAAAAEVAAGTAAAAAAAAEKDDGNAAKQEPPGWGIVNMPPAAGEPERRREAAAEDDEEGQLRASFAKDDAARGGP